MSETRYIQNALNSGELSPRLNARDDYDRYASGVKTMLNWFPLPHGGARVRYGSIFVAHTKNDALAYLIPFEFSTVQAYVIEAGDQYFRFYKNNARIADLSGGVTNAVNNGVGLIRLTATAHGLSTNNYMSVTAVGGTTEANGEWKVTVIDANTVDLQGSVFTNAYTSGGTWYRPYEIVTPYLIADIPLLKWAQSADTLYIAHPLYAPRTLTRTGDTAWTLASAVFLDGPYMKANTTSTTLTVSANTGTGLTMTASAALFDTSSPSKHIGSFWRIKGNTTWGYVKVTAVTSATVCTVDVILALDFPTPGTSTTTNWREGSFSTLRGFPAVDTIFEQRSIWGSTAAELQTIWGSTTGSYVDMSPGAVSGSIADSDAFTYRLGSRFVNVLRWLLGARDLLIGTVGEEFSMFGGAGTALVATASPITRSGTAYGSSTVQAVRIANKTYYVQVSGRKIRAMEFAFTQDTYISPDVSLPSEHLLRNNLAKRMAYQTEPDSILWIVRDDGALISFTVYDLEKVYGWALHQTSGSYQDVAVIPTADITAKQLWTVVKRTINGVVKYFVEYFDPTVNVDAGLTYSGVATSTVTGLDHLNGASVKIVGNDAVYDDQTVVGGSVTLKYGTSVGPAQTSIQVGLAKSPNPKIVTLPPAFKDAAGVVRTKWKHWATCEVALEDTLGLSINNNDIQYRKPSDPMDAAPPRFTGDKIIPNLLTSREGQITFEQKLPLPATILAYFGELDVGD